VEVVHRTDQGLSRLALTDSVGERFQTLRHLVEEDVLLRREVVEHRLLGDARLLRYVGDGNVIEAACDEETHPCGGDRLARLQLLGLAQAH
jgi:hypothetical protein